MRVDKGRREPHPDFDSTRKDEGPPYVLSDPTMRNPRDFSTLRPFVSLPSRRGPPGIPSIVDGVGSPSPSVTTGMGVSRDLGYVTKSSSIYTSQSLGHTESPHRYVTSEDLDLHSYR